jgi:hypothetical protein
MLPKHALRKVALVPGERVLSPRHKEPQGRQPPLRDPRVLVRDIFLARSSLAEENIFCGSVKHPAAFDRRAQVR